MNYERKKNLKSLLQGAVMVVILLVFLFPLIWAFLTSLKSNVEAWSMPPKLFFKPSFHNYKDIFVNRNLQLNIVNSIIVALGSTAIYLRLAKYPPDYHFSPFHFLLSFYRVDVKRVFRGNTSRD